MREFEQLILFIKMPYYRNTSIHFFLSRLKTYFGVNFLPDLLTLYPRNVYVGDISFWETDADVKQFKP